MTKRLRQVLVLLHLFVAFGWLASTLAVLLLAGSGQPAAASLVDDRLLADFSFMTVYTGLMLAGTSNWGFVRFWWVTVKLVAAIGLALGGRALFGNGVPIAGGMLMAVAIAVLAWIGRAKPWGRLRPGEPGRYWSHPAIYLAILVTPVLDYITGLPLQAIPAAAVIVLRTVPVRRGPVRTGRTRGPGGLWRPGGRRSGTTRTTRPGGT